VGAVGRSSLWDLAIFGGVVPEAEPRRQPFEDEETGIAVLARMPVYIGAHVRNPLSLAATLTALRSAAFSAAPGLLEWGEVGTYRDVPIVAIRARPGAAPGPRNLDQLGLHYAVAKDVFVASLDRDTLELQIDAALDGRMAAAVAPEQAQTAPDGTQADLRIALAGATSWLGRAVLGLFEGEARRALEDARLDVEVLARGRGGLPTDPAAFRATALAGLGYEPRAVQGGAFTLTPEGLVGHERYGSPLAPVFPEVPVAAAPLTKVVTSLRQLGMNVAFEGEGAARGLRVQMVWERR
jgi:hypothetical protein